MKKCFKVFSVLLCLIITIIAIEYFIGSRDAELEDLSTLLIEYEEPNTSEVVNVFPGVEMTFNAEEYDLVDKFHEGESVNNNKLNAVFGKHENDLYKLRELIKGKVYKSRHSRHCFDMNINLVNFIEQMDFYLFWIGSQNSDIKKFESYIEVLKFLHLMKVEAKSTLELVAVIGKKQRVMDYISRLVDTCIDEDLVCMDLVGVSMRTQESLINLARQEFSILSRTYRVINKGEKSELYSNFEDLEYMFHPMLQPYFYHPNRTTNQTAAYFKSCIERFENQASYEEFVELTSKMNQRAFEVMADITFRNKIGTSLHQLFTSNLDYPYSKIYLSHARFEMLKIKKALKLYSFKYGDYPKELSLLVPEFMNEVPENIINGGSFYYSLEDQLISCDEKGVVLNARNRVNIYLSEEARKNDQN